MLRNQINADGIKQQLLVVRINDWGPECFKLLDPFSQSPACVLGVPSEVLAVGGCEERLGLLQAGHGWFQTAPQWTHHRAQLSPLAKVVVPLGNHI